ncbi:hypothetical protein B4U79_18906 [Dinothrombium tinctorium]|uniref:RING-type domain-containing protein n=1 Tax=Dinothrombium tinctorium TaxID=1965070 RepID=A0A443Q621_9ACAR|nr:hypothetical protein B4U79_18906 [Dinothrombium tinctorium]
MKITGFILKNAVLKSNEQHMFILNHLITVECNICLNTVSGDKMMMLFMCGHTTCLQCVLSLRDKKFEKCPFCTMEIVYIFPFMQLPENFVDNCEVYDRINVHTGQIDVIENKKRAQTNKNDLYKTQIFINVEEIQFIILK